MRPPRSGPDGIQPVDPPRDVVLTCPDGLVELGEQPVELLVVAALGHQDAHRAAELVDGLLGEGTGHDGTSADADDGAPQVSAHAPRRRSVARRPTG